MNGHGDPVALFLELGPRQQQPINYGTGDVLLDETGWYAELGLVGRFSPLPWLGWSFGGSLGTGTTGFIDSLTAAELEVRGDLSVYVKPLVTDSIEIWVGPTLHAGGSLIDVYDSAWGLPDDDAFNGFVGAGLFTRVWFGSFYVEPDYRFRHTGVDAHYLGGQLGIDLGTLELYVDFEQRVAAAGGVPTSIYDFATSYFQTAPTKTYFAGGIALGF